jgi:hypothetical protein
MNILRDKCGRDEPVGYCGVETAGPAPDGDRGWLTFQVYGLPPTRIKSGIRSRTKTMRTTRGCSEFFFSVLFSILVG